MNILNKSLYELKEALGTDFSKGLSAQGVHANTEAFGLNLPFEQDGNTVQMFLRSLLSDVMPWLFIGLFVLSLALGRDSSLPVLIVLFSAYIAIRLCAFLYIRISNRKINRYRQIYVTVIRSGKKQKIESRRLVPGDIVLLKPGDFLPCDGIVIDSRELSVYESFITSNSAPVNKYPQEQLPEDEPYHGCLIFAGSAVASGMAKVLVCHTAKNIFNIQNSPLKKLFANEMPTIYKNNIFVGKQIYLLWILMCFVLFAIGVLMKYDVFDMFFMSVTLSLAALGDCIPLFSEAAVISSVARLYKKHGCILKNYKAIDIFNATDAVFIENFNYFLNSMPEINSFCVSSGLYSPENIPLQIRDEIIKYALVSMLQRPKSRRYTDISLTKYAASVGITLKSVENEFIYISGDTGSTDAVLAFRNGEYAVVTRGFAADILNRCTTIDGGSSVREIGRNERFALQNQIHNMELASQTVVAIAKKRVEFTEQNKSYFVNLDQMTLLGFIGFYNPINTEAVKSLSLCRKNNISVILMDNSPMGAYIDMAKSTSLLSQDDLYTDSLGLANLDIGLLHADLKKYRLFSQLTPEQQVYIAKLYKQNGSVLTCIPNSFSNIALQAACDASVTVLDPKQPALNNFSDAVLLNKDFSKFTELVKNAREIYGNANKVLLFILTNQFFICTLILAGMIFEKRLIFQPASLLLYGIFSIFPSAMSLSCSPPPSDKALPPPNYNRYIFNILSLIPPPLITGLAGGIVTVLVYRIYHAVPQVAAAASLTTLFASTFLIAVSLRSENLFIKRKLSPSFIFSLLTAAAALALVFLLKPLSDLFSMQMPGIEVAIISLLFSLIPFFISEIIKKAKNLTK